VLTAASKHVCRFEEFTYDPDVEQAPAQAEKGGPKDDVVSVGALDDCIDFVKLYRAISRV